MKHKLLISFSGGRTSAYMLWWLLNCWEEKNNWDMVVVFANTGKEHEGTLEFIEKCSKHFNIEIILVEAVPIQSKKGKWWGVKHKIVTFDTVARKGEPFEAMLSKLGIPTTNAPFCSDQLKKKAIKSYMRSIGWKKYWTAIGMRYDEPKRIKKNRVKLRLFYPLYDHTVMSKHDILFWWATEMPFNLTIPVGAGNCDNCWKKNLNMLTVNAKTNPKSFNWWQEMTDKYGHIQNRPSAKKLKPPFNFYRGNKSANDILKLATEKTAEEIRKLALLEPKSDCSESCEPF